MLRGMKKYSDVLLAHERVPIVGLVMMPGMHWRYRSRSQIHMQ